MFKIWKVELNLETRQISYSFIELLVLFPKALVNYVVFIDWLELTKLLLSITREVLIIFSKEEFSVIIVMKISKTKLLFITAIVLDWEIIKFDYKFIIN